MILEKDFISKHKIKTKVTNSFRRTKCWLLIKIEASTMKWLSFQCFRVNTTIVIIDCNDFRCWLFVSHSKISKNDQMFFSQQFIINDRFQTELEIVVSFSNDFVNVQLQFHREHSRFHVNMYRHIEYRFQFVLLRLHRPMYR